ncbi:ATP-binding protein [Collinsella sp. zg1085]|uniref:ATP-binding protein n=1 Tax=Collinsella sp. zg1085 TaxID=2844380 RepID=UPI001C0AD7F6|nr:ATP-binding protein [Collinsella sp. zg1085]QWT17602.1 ATP-binding protein [Collinsella sp. zg1085]
MAEDFYPFVDSGDPTPDNAHLISDEPVQSHQSNNTVSYATRIAIYDDLFSTPRVVIIQPQGIRSYLEEVTNTVYRLMREQGGHIALMVIREIVENFIHAQFVEPIISILDDGNTLRFADQGPGIHLKERAFEFGVTSANREQKRYIRGTGAGFPMVSQYLEQTGGLIAIEDNLGSGTVVTVTIDDNRAQELQAASSHGAVIRGHQKQQPDATPSPQHTTNDVNPNPYGNQTFPLQSSSYPAQLNPYYQQQPVYPTAAPMTVMPGYINPYQPMPAQTAQYIPTPQPAITQALNTYLAEQAAEVDLYVSERGKKILSYLLQFESCGPTELRGAFGSSTATWSRELEQLTSAGLVIKRGQKRMLTDMGRMWTQQHTNKL